MSNKFDYNQPRKQSIKGLLVLFVYQFQEILRQFWLPLLYLIFKLNFKEHPEYYLAILGLIVLVFVVVYLKYVNYTFHINSKLKEFVIEEGIFNKTKLSITFNKIQQVNINQSFIQKLVNVYSLSIDTAGSDKNEVKIKALNLETAEFLKLELMENSKFDSSNKESFEKEKLVFKTSLFTLLKVAITSQYGKSIAILLGFIATIYNTIDDLTRNFDLDSSIIDQEVAINRVLNSITILIIFTLIIVFIINIVNIFIKYYNFSIIKILDSLSISSGLFSTKNKLLKPEKVQTITYSQNYFQKKLNFFNLKIQQATGDEFSKQSIDNQIFVPGCSQEELNKILNFLYQNQPKKELILLPKIQFFVPVFVFLIFIPLVIFYTLGFIIYRELFNYQVMVLIYIILVLIYNLFKYKNSALYFDGTYIQKRFGAWDVSYQIVAAHKLQGFTLQQKIWHQKNDIGDLIFHTASGSFSFRFAQYSKLEKYVNYWLYKVES